MDSPFQPVSFDPSPGFRDPDAPPPKKPRGGPRPGSGAPKGNLNALKHGRNSKQQQRLIELLTEVPEARDALLAMARRNRQRRKRAELQAATLLLRWAEKLGGAPGSENNQLQDNQRLARALATLKAQLEEIQKKQPNTKRP